MANKSTIKPTKQFPEAYKQVLRASIIVQTLHHILTDENIASAWGIKKPSVTEMKAKLRSKDQ